jgi:hypothetical protein
LSSSQRYDAIIACLALEHSSNSKRGKLGTSTTAAAAAAAAADSWKQFNEIN